MAISTIRKQDSSFSSIILYFLGIVGVGLVVFFGGEIIRNFDNIRGKAGLSVQVVSGEADVYINDKYIGKTPFESNEIKPGENKITLRSGEVSYQTNIEFLSSDNNFIHVVGIIRDLGISETFSSGYELWFEKENSANTLRIISEPSEATVYLDNVEIGKTPFASNNISEGDYELKVTKAGYESQSTRINVKKGYTLNAKLKLFPYPITPQASSFEESPNLYDLSSENPVVTSDTQNWAKAVSYWNKTRGINLEETGENKQSVFDYFLDYKGNIFNKEGILLNTTEELNTLKDSQRGAYLGTMDTTGLSIEAKQSFLELMQTLGTGKTATISNTPTGWLRVRESPSLNAKEIDRVNTGNTYNVIEENGDWVKIKVSEDKQGWVSATYVKVEDSSF